MRQPLELRDHEREVRSFKLRLGFAALLTLVLFGILIARAFHLQVVRFEHYHTLAEDNRISIVPIPPNRGIIRDRNGVVLAHNYSAYTLEITPDKAENLNETLRTLGTVIEITPRDLKRFQKALAENRKLESLAIRTRLNDEEIARVAVNRYRLPGVEIRARLFRHYPLGTVASHAVGYIGRINDADLERIESAGESSNYRGSDHVGKTGIEQSYERELHGITGFEQVEIDAGGRAVRTLDRKPPTSGNDLVLSLDIKLQEIAENAFGDYRGSVVAIDPRNGEVLAFVSKPGFDPNLFVDGIDSANWQALNNSPDKPLTNRALHGLYPPGSTFKPFMALAALGMNIRAPSYAISDPGFFTLPGSSHRYRDWKKGGHGTVDMFKSIVVSCDTYYYGLANQMGITALHDYIERFGFGKKTGIDIQGESPGLLPSPAWKLKRFKQPWYPGETVITGIGQGYTLATPMQLAYGTSLLANNGIAITPHLVRAVEDSRSKQLKPLQFARQEVVKVAPASTDLVRRAMVAVTQPGGTAAKAGANSPYLIAGKTGTAQVVGIKQNEKYNEKLVKERHLDHALFVAYAPADDPKIAVGIIVENGRHGGSTAAPIVRQMMDYYLLGKVPSAPAVTTESVAQERATEHD